MIASVRGRVASVSPDGTRVAWWTWVVETSPDGMVGFSHYRRFAVARATGFGTVETMRRSFHRRLGVGPAEYRARFTSTQAA